ncbi:RNase H domain protein [Phlyctema vagabunda]|uniref:ribonuclease H n=1 Tax=Phlyctema vagabunda TaxID=108571 RepID=A0ABR4PE25_9HELO
MPVEVVVVESIHETDQVRVFLQKDNIRLSEARSRTLHAKTALDKAAAEYEAAKETEKEIESQRFRNSYTVSTIPEVCLNCRQSFNSRIELYQHTRADCWATISEETYPECWTPESRIYVREALHPTNSNPVPGGNYPLAFNAPGSTPQSLFKHEYGKPFLAVRDSQEMLILAHGSCSRNGQADASAGCAFVFQFGDSISRTREPQRGSYELDGTIFFRLEEVGPDGWSNIQTCCRAELRAVIAALSYPRIQSQELVFWGPKQDAKLVIASNSKYVVDSAVNNCEKWNANGWLNKNKKPVKNRDLWECLLERVRELKTHHCEKISFWHVPKNQIRAADMGARFAAALEPREKFGDPHDPSVKYNQIYTW